MQGMHVVSVRLHYFLISLNIIWLPWQHSLAKSENKVQIPHLHPKCSHMVTKFSEPRCELAVQFPSVCLFSAETTGLIFTKILHYIVGFTGAIKSSYTQHLPFFNKIGCHGNVPWDIGKIGPDRLSAPKTLSFDERIAKIYPVDPEIIVLPRNH